MADGWCGRQYISRMLSNKMFCTCIISCVMIFIFITTSCSSCVLRMLLEFVALGSRPWPSRLVLLSFRDGSGANS